MSIENGNLNKNTTQISTNAPKKKKKAKVKVFNNKKRLEPESTVIQKLQERYDSVSDHYNFFF